MNEEPIEAKEVRYISVDHLLDWSLEEMKKSLGLPYTDLSPFSKVVEADKLDLTPEQQAEIDALIALPDDQIDTRDAPELPDWSKAQQGLFYNNTKGEDNA